MSVNQPSLHDHEGVCAFHEKAGRCQELISIPAISSYKDYLRHRGRGQSRPRCSEPVQAEVQRAEREAWTGGGDAKPSLTRKWQAALVPSLFFFCKITASVAILPSALLNEPFRLHASWAFSFQWVLPSECQPRSPQMPGSPILAQTAVTRTRRLILSNFFGRRGYYAASRLSSR